MGNIFEDKGTDLVTREAYLAFCIITNRVFQCIPNEKVKNMSSMLKGKENTLRNTVCSGKNGRKRFQCSQRKSAKNISGDKGLIHFLVLLKVKLCLLPLRR